jgi:hypothetical protein
LCGRMMCLPVISGRAAEKLGRPAGCVGRRADPAVEASKQQMEWRVTTLVVDSSLRAAQLLSLCAVLRRHAAPGPLAPRQRKVHNSSSSTAPLTSSSLCGNLAGHHSIERGADGPPDGACRSVGCSADPVICCKGRLLLLHRRGGRPAGAAWRCDGRPCLRCCAFTVVVLCGVGLNWARGGRLRATGVASAGDLCIVGVGRAQARSLCVDGGRRCQDSQSSVAGEQDNNPLPSLL